ELQAQPAVNSLNKYLVKARLGALGNFLAKGNVAHDEYFLHVYDDFTLVFASKPVMEKFLNDGAKPKPWPTDSTPSPNPNPNPNPGGKPATNPEGNPERPPMPPAPPVPPTGPMKMSFAPVRPQDDPATEPGVEVVVLDADYQLVAFQSGQPGPGG